MKYVWINEEDSVISNEDSLIEVPWVEPSFCKVLMSCPWFLGLMAYELMIWKKLCVICYVLWHELCEKFICWVQYDMHNDACYSNCMTFLTQFGNYTNFSKLNLASLLTWLPKIMSLVQSCSFSCMSLVCSCIYAYLVQVCTNPINLYYFMCRHRWSIVAGSLLQLSGRQHSFEVW